MQTVPEVDPGPAKIGELNRRDQNAVRLTAPDVPAAADADVAVCADGNATDAAGRVPGAQQNTAEPKDFNHSRVLVRDEGHGGSGEPEQLPDKEIDYGHDGRSQNDLSDQTVVEAGGEADGEDPELPVGPKTVQEVQGRRRFYGEEQDAES